MAQPASCSMAIPATACCEPPADGAEHAAALMELSRGNAVRRPDCDRILDSTWYRSGTTLSIHSLEEARGTQLCDNGKDGSRSPGLAPVLDIGLVR